MLQKNYFSFVLVSFFLVESCSVPHKSLSYFKSHLDEFEISDSDSIVVIPDGKILLSKEAGESGDYVNFHLQYYQNNRLKYYKRISRFFNSLCVDGVLVESEEYDVNGTSLELKKRTIRDENGKKINPAGCQFPYRFPFSLTYNLK